MKKKEKESKEEVRKMLFSRRNGVRRMVHIKKFQTLTIRKMISKLGELIK